MAKKATHSKSTSARAKAVIEERVDIQARMHNLVSEAISTGTLDLADVKQASEDVVVGMKAALADAMPHERSNILNQTYSGLAGGVAAGVAKAEEALRSAKEAGERISTKELARLSTTLHSIEEEFLKAASRAAQSLGDQSRAEWRSLVEQSKTVGTAIGPAAHKALIAVGRHGPAIAIETAKAGSRAAFAVAGEMAMGVSGLLSGLGTAIKRAHAKPAPAAKPKKTPAKHKPAAKKKKSK